MAKRSNTRESDTQDKLEKQVKPAFNKVASVRVSRRTLRLRYPVRYVYRSEVTNERIEWNGAGSTASVHFDDVPILLSKVKKDTSCCGGSPNRSDYYLFEEV